MMTTTATLDENGNFHHFGIRKETSSLYGDSPESIKQVSLEIHENQDKPTKEEFKEMCKTNIPDYWGWRDAGKDEFSLIYQQRFLLDMCFPAGLDTTEKNGRGNQYRLKVTEI
jgi:hypothetical protein